MQGSLYRSVPAYQDLAGMEEEVAPRPHAGRRGVAPLPHSRAGRRRFRWYRPVTGDPHTGILWDLHMKGIRWKLVRFRSERWRGRRRYRKVAFEEGQRSREGGGEPLLSGFLSLHPNKKSKNSAVGACKCT
ncbi:hypothetical protein BHE74_00010785 [Ensete ventricosum]|nr:hypothetical protein BHE74_00010785 [Ensete ventricosum]